MIIYTTIKSTFFFQGKHYFSLRPCEIFTPSLCIRFWLKLEGYRSHLSLFLWKIIIINENAIFEAIFNYNILCLKVVLLYIALLRLALTINSYKFVRFTFRSSNVGASWFRTLWLTKDRLNIRARVGIDFEPRLV